LAAYSNILNDRRVVAYVLEAPMCPQSALSNLSNSLHRRGAVLLGLRSLLAIARRSLGQIVHVTEIVEIVHTENQDLFERGFAEIWRNAQRRRSEYLSSVSRQFFHGTKLRSSIGRATRVNANIITSPEHDRLALDSKNIVAADNTSNPPDRSSLDSIPSMETAAPNRDKHLPSYPAVEVVVSAITDWVRKYRYRFGLYNQFGQCGSDEVMQETAKDLGATLNKFREFASKGPGAADLLEKMLGALHVDPKVFADTNPHVMRDLQRVCINCSGKKRCKHEFANGKAAQHFWDFCPNSATLDVLFVSSRPGPVANYRR
jgi:hypothetical protein